MSAGQSDFDESLSFIFYSPIVVGIRNDRRKL
jgi:hypothetical protein